MTPEELVGRACPKIAAIGGAFYFQPETLARGKELGLDGFRFYVLGRGGVLGDTDSRVVASAFGYFHPAVIERIWTSAREKIAPAEAAAAYLECGRAFGRARFAAIDGLDAFCAAAGAVNDAADPAGLALYAGVSSFPLPDDLPARAMQLATVLREHRGSAHLLAVIASGVRPPTAHAIRRPDAVKTFGWEAEPPQPTAIDRARLQEADTLTDQLVLPAFSVLDEDGRQALLRGLEAMERAVTAPG